MGRSCARERDTRNKFAPLTHHPIGGKVPHMGNISPGGEDLLTTAQVAEITGWSITSINRWALAGDLKPVRKLPGRTGPYLFDRAEIERIARERSAA